ncbi:MAG: hypothetical protein EOP82_30745 [Variovorax sp.]|nr:MAG: hypothetical protein EOP82_30745 [Variovorax sp.]
MRRPPRLLNFETSIASGSLSKGFDVTHSTVPGRVGQPAFPLYGFSMEADGTVRQQVAHEGIATERRFVIDTIEPGLEWAQSTGQTSSADAWRVREAATPQRYTRPLD